MSLAPESVPGDRASCNIEEIGQKLGCLPKTIVFRLRVTGVRGIEDRSEGVRDRLDCAPVGLGGGIVDTRSSSVEERDARRKHHMEGNQALHPMQDMVLLVGVQTDRPNGKL